MSCQLITGFVSNSIVARTKGTYEGRSIGFVHIVFGRVVGRGQDGNRVGVKVGDGVGYSDGNKEGGLDGDLLGG